ncbi:hypothetical protein BDF21DRAFT_448642 [Thamnidium elegans]|uniref:SP-RING-type domain-containing protein n=1 Tax=Thamnidium elegans TaxID=101142 RepID=A0A8H7SZ92_9FUNG|nr:hypothetical protein INT48_002006 [Thamnidium elegans]KAI8094451.1 hypothetical protein BDF21DRAFT_448642 [Thamnidium elegans]
MNINLYRRRRLRSTQPILTRVQIRDLGRKIGFTSFRQSVEYFMDPYNYFKLSKIKMADIHQYLWDQGITHEKCPNTHIRQGDHSRVLISILFPGYPIIKASEQHYRDLRENRSPQAKIIDLAYDQLPITDKFERLEELYRTEVDWHKLENDSKQYTVEIPLKKLNRSIVVEGHASSKLNVRLFLYLWSSERMAWTPSSISLSVDHSAEDCLSAQDKKLHEYGFNHIDITETTDAITKATRRSTGSLPFIFTFHGKRPNIRHVSVCAVIEKSSQELTSQLYVQTASLYIGQAMESSSRNVPQAQAVQKQVIELLRPFDLKDKLDLIKTETIFLSCAEKFLTAWNNHDKEDKEEDDKDIEVYTGGEYVSVLDPIMLSRIEHPTRCIFCTHNTCFDAEVFFKFQVTSMQWKCPICLVKIRGIQDLYIDYHAKLALKKHPNEERFLLEKNDVYLPIEPLAPIQVDMKNIPEKRTVAEIISLDDDNDEITSKRQRS